MKVLIVNTFDSGGAANACLRLHEGLLRKGVDSKVLLMRKQKQHPKTFQIENPQHSKSKLTLLKQKIFSALRILKLIPTPAETKERQFLKSRQRELELFSFPYSDYDITNSPLYQEADIINLHWVAKFLDYDSFFRKNTKPVVWTLHDMNAFTGGEHYSEVYLGMDSLGNPISRAISKLENQIFTEILSFKKRVIHPYSNITVVAPSKWLVEEAQKSEVFKSKPIHCIPYGINSDIFRIRDRNYSREILNIPKDKTVILFVADSISNHRKGYTYLKKALDALQRDDVVLCAVGRKKNDLVSGTNTIELGAIVDERLMSIAYSAADVFVIPSLMDNLPNTVLESLMCGTPVIGFPIGGIPDMVKHGFNGLISSEVNSSSLFKTIELFLNTMESFERNEIRNDALSKYDLPIQAQNYLKLYQNILNS